MTQQRKLNDFFIAGEATLQKDKAHRILANLLRNLRIEISPKKLKHYICIILEFRIENSKDVAIKSR